MKKLLFLLVPLLLSVSAARAAAAPITLDGDYYLYSDAQKDGHPVCTERWRFGPEGDLTVFSGQEVANHHFRTEADDDDNWFLERFLSTNGKPDCMGGIADNVPTDESRYFMYRTKAGGIQICTTESSQGGRTLNCVGYLLRASESDQPKPGN